MKNRLVLIVLLVASFFIFLFFYNKYRVAPSFQLFQMPLYDVHGNQTSLESFRGKKLIITFYASWCRDCLVELKALNEIKSARFPDVEIICITDDPPEKLSDFIQKKNYPFRFFRSTKDFPELKIYSIPVNYLVNSSGQVVMEKVGVINWEDNSLVTRAMNLLQ